MASAHEQNNKRRRHASSYSSSLGAGVSAKSALPNLDSFAFNLSCRGGPAVENGRLGFAKDCCLEVGTSSAMEKLLQLSEGSKEAARESSSLKLEFHTRFLGSSQLESGKAEPAVENGRLGIAKESFLEVRPSLATEKSLQPPEETKRAGQQGTLLVLEHSKAHPQFLGSSQQESGHKEPTLNGSKLGEAVPGACDALVAVTQALVTDLEGLTFRAPVSCVYNPLVYAQDVHEQYIRRHGGRRIEVLLVGMNPGPYGMAQTGVPFGDSSLVKTFHGLSGKVGSPEIPHPKRPIHGLECKRSEVSGQRLWGWAQVRFGTADAFFNRFWVYNYCPLVFMEASGKNRTPDKLHPLERTKLEATCNRALTKTILILRPVFVIGVGKYAASKIRECNINGVKVGDIMHPSPANPQANKEWGKKVEAQLLELGVNLPF